MKITIIDKLFLWFRLYRELPRMPGRAFLKTFLFPFDPVRFEEYFYLFKFCLDSVPSSARILDLSSPYGISYLASRNHQVVKTDINPAEQSFIKETDNLTFATADATQLTYADATFDLVYSVSVIEHIYQRYNAALKEMMRVLKPGGILYLSFPVSPTGREEWLNENIYSNQSTKQNQVFFQYRFSETQVAEILSIVQAEASDIQSFLLWERFDGFYDWYVNTLRFCNRLSPVLLLPAIVLNFGIAFLLLAPNPASFRSGKKFGNIQIAIRKNSATL